jgi:hypothetical protein
MGPILAVSCLSANDRPLRIRDTEDGGPPVIDVDGGAGTTGRPPDASPHAVLGVSPSHGPASGGTLVLIRGNGFASNARVWFGDQELASDEVTAVDAERIQVTVPPGRAGAVDVIVQNGDDESTRGVLRGGYTYDQFYAEPPNGPTAGGTLIRLHGQETNWDESTRVEIDQNPCEVEEFVGPEELTCRVPPGTPGAKAVRTITGDETISVLDAFAYVNSDNGNRGGISGDPLDRNLSVLVFNGYTGEAVERAKVIIGADVDDGLGAETDSNGVAVISDDSLKKRATVTVAKHCFQPVTFVDVPSERLTVYLDPVLSAACGAGGGIPGGGGTPGRASGIEGEIVWPASGEFKRAGWTNVPDLASDDEKYVAYVFRLAASPTDRFTLPSPLNAVTPFSNGTAGFEFSLTSSPGNYTVYALAGLRDDSKKPPKFTAYAIGVTHGVSVAPGEYREDVFIKMDVTLEHSFTLDVTGPTPTPRGPDRLQATLAIAVGSQGYVLLPNGYQERLLPVSGSIDFVGVPPLVGSLAGSRYVTTARAVTGQAGGTPLSVVGLLSTTVTSEPVGADEFIEVPRLVSPGTNQAWNGRDLELEFPAGGAPVSLTRIDIESGGGLVTWSIVAPGKKKAIVLPDLRRVEGDVGLIPGPLSVQVTAARVEDFAYSALRYRDLDSRGWRSHATDIFHAALP